MPNYLSLSRTCIVRKISAYRLAVDAQLAYLPHLRAEHARMGVQDSESTSRHVSEVVPGAGLDALGGPR